MLFLLAAAAPALAYSQPPPDPLSQRLLASHNIERASVRLPPLQWDAQLAAAAAGYAVTLAVTGHLQHSPLQSRPGQGENVWMGTRGAYTPEQMVGSWAGERRWFRAGVFPNVSTTGKWQDVAHYTQMIWPATTRVGCAISSSRQWDFLVCRYSPQGNIWNGRVP